MLGEFNRLRHDQTLQLVEFNRLRHGQTLQFVQRHLHDFHRLLGSGEGDQQVSVMLDDVGIVDVTSANQPEELGERRGRPG